MEYIRRSPLTTLVLGSAIALTLTGCGTNESAPPAAANAEVQTSAKSTQNPQPVFGSPEATEEAVAFAKKFARAAHTNGYFLGGEWAANGGSVDEVQEFLGKYLSQDLLDELDIWKEKSNRGEDFTEKFTSLVAFWDESDYYSPYKTCTTTDPKRCTLSLKQGKPASQVDKSNETVEVKFSQTTAFPLWSKEINQDVKTTATYKYDLEVAPVEQGGWEIVSYSINMEFSSLEPFTP